MEDIRVYLRQGDITFSKRFIETLRDIDITPTRRNKFMRSGIIINHGNSTPIEVGKKVKKLYILNQPSAIKFCANKITNYEALDAFYPPTYDIHDIHDKTDSIFPLLAKPIKGHHGYGIIKLNSYSEFDKLENRSSYIYQELIDIKHEFRFNILDRNIYQISRKNKLEDITENGGMMFEYTSLGGLDTKAVSQKMFDYVYNVIGKFHEVVGTNLAHYVIDIMKSIDGKYYLTELNSACGLGPYTVGKLDEAISEKYLNTRLEKYRVR